MSGHSPITQSSQETLNLEYWKEIESTGGIYSVSNLGRIKRNTTGGNTFVGKILTGRISPKGYYNVVLGCHGKPRQRLVHTVVCEVFLGPKPKGFQCNHKDGIKTNNRIDNLEYVTASENVKHAYRQGLIPNGENHLLHIRSLQRTHCSRGHALTQDNIVPGNAKRCLICHKAAAKRYRQMRGHQTTSF
jgi:hypothetical protein